MKDKLKLGLFALIGVALVANVVVMLTGSDEAGADPHAGHNHGAPASKITPPVANEVVDNTPKTTITFEEYAHSFGNIKQNTENKKVFSFTNTGNEPLIITNAKGSCGCTVPNYPKEPVQPGESAEIEVFYRPGKQKGNQSKTVTITANTEPAQTILNISATVEEVPVEETPAQ